MVVKCFIKLTPGANFINLFTDISYEFSYYARAFVPGKPFQTSVMLGKAYARVEHLKGTPLLGRLMALPTNTRLGWKGLPGTNALAYYEKS
jgi:hypothetical protein